MAGRGAATGPALAAVVLIAAGCGGGSTTTTVTVTRTHTVTTTRTVTKKTHTAAAPCAGGQLSGTFALVPGSAGAGHVEYVLTLHNTSQTACSLHGVPDAGLLGSDGSPLPTAITRGDGGGKAFVLAPGASAKAAARFSPDVPGPGDNQTGACQPKAYTLRITLPGGGTTDAAIQPPTSVCVQGQLQFQPFSTS
jgi:hypothetical protein